MLLKKLNFVLFFYFLQLLDTQVSSADKQINYNQYQKIIAIKIEEINEKISQKDIVIKILNRANNLCNTKFNNTFGAKSFELTQTLLPYPHFLFKKIICAENESESAKRLDIHSLKTHLDSILNGETCLFDSTTKEILDKKLKSNLENIEALIHQQIPMNLEELQNFKKNAEKKIWLDLLPVEKYSLSKNSQIPKLIERYENIDKTKSKNIFSRISLLKVISKKAQSELIYFLNSPIKTDDQKKELESLELILQTSINKRRYLFSLKEIPRKIEKLLFSRSNICGLTLPRKACIDWKERVSALDPAGRSNLDKDFEKWSFLVRDENPERASFPSFYYWLEKKSTDPEKYELLPDWQLDTESRRLKFHEDGTSWCQQYGDPIQPKASKGRDETYIYMVDGEGEIYISDQGVHSEIKRSENSLSAGLIHFKDGKISRLNAESGHYTPKDFHLKTAYDVIRKRNSNVFHKDFKMEFWQPQNRNEAISKKTVIDFLKIWPFLSNDEKKQLGTISDFNSQIKNYKNFEDLYQNLTDQKIYQNTLSLLKEELRQKIESKNSPIEIDALNKQIIDEEKKLKIFKIWSSMNSFQKADALEEASNLFSHANQYNQNFHLDNKNQQKLIEAVYENNFLPKIIDLELEINEAEFVLFNYIQNSKIENNNLSDTFYRIKKLKDKINNFVKNPKTNSIEDFNFQLLEIEIQIKNLENTINLVTLEKNIPNYNWKNFTQLSKKYKPNNGFQDSFEMQSNNLSIVELLHLSKNLKIPPEEINVLVNNENIKLSTLSKKRNLVWSVYYRSEEKVIQDFIDGHLFMKIVMTPEGLIMLNNTLQRIKK